MKKIQDIDKNFEVKTSLLENDLKFYNVKDEPFDLYGFYKVKQIRRFLRLPQDVAEATNEGVKSLNYCTAGGRVRFKTNSYQEIVSRWLDQDYINLGFSGSARAEKPIAEYIKNLDMSCFVYDYDHNAPDEEYLKKTHNPMFRLVREKNPELPIIMMSMPTTNDKEEYIINRRKIILDTYNEAVKNGDKNVYFIDGTKIFEPFGGDSSTVDNVHPNDLGFMCMAEKVYEVLRKIFWK